MCTFIGEQCFPISDGCFPLCTFGCVRAAFAVFECLFIWGNQACARAAFDGHVTHGHTTFHGQITDRFATVLNHIACTACSACFTDNGQCNVLGSHTGAKFACDLDLHVL